MGNVPAFFMTMFLSVCPLGDGECTPEAVTLAQPVEFPESACDDAVLHINKKMRDKGLYIAKHKCLRTQGVLITP